MVKILLKQRCELLIKVAYISAFLPDEQSQVQREMSAEIPEDGTATPSTGLLELLRMVNNI